MSPLVSLLVWRGGVDIGSDCISSRSVLPGRVAQSVARLTQEQEVPGSIPGPAIYFRFSFR